jgi:hypothetical protein
MTLSSASVFLIELCMEDKDKEGFSLFCPDVHPSTRQVPRGDWN